MAAVIASLETIGHPESKIHYEFFGPKQEIAKCPVH